MSESPSDIIEVEIDLDLMAAEIIPTELVPAVTAPPETALPESAPPAEPSRAAHEPETPQGFETNATPAPQPQAPQTHATQSPSPQSHAAQTQEPLPPARPPHPPLSHPPQSHAAQTPPLLAAPRSPAPPAPQPSAANALPAPFAEIVSLVADERLRSLATSTLARILKSLEALRGIEEALTRQKVLSVGPPFRGVREQATSLLSFLTEAAVRGDIDERFREVLDGIRFVMAHEVGKVYSYEFPSLTDEGPSRYSRAELTRAWGLLNNCLQQTAITLARAIDPAATGQRLFEDYRRKTENSLTLYNELNVLLQKVKTAEKANGILLKHSLVRHLEHFREETMHFLMYKDWGEFGRYVDEVKRAFEEMEEFDCVLHGFAQYLTTLIHHVGMREVLRARQAQRPRPRAAARPGQDAGGGR